MPEDSDDLPDSPYTSQDTAEMNNNVVDESIFNNDNYIQQNYLPHPDVNYSPGYCDRVKADL